MKLRFKAAVILSSVALASGSALVAFSKSPPPPPPLYNPQVLYVVGSKGGSTSTITVSNADGTDVVSLYTSKNITGLNNVKFSTTANQIVFSEQNVIKVLTYAVSSQGVTTTSVKTLTSEPYTVLHVDVSPDGTQLLFVEHTANPNEWAVHAMSMNGLQGPTQIGLMPATYYDAVWAHSNSRIAVIQGGPVEAGFGTQTIQLIDLDVGNNYTPGAPTTVITSTMVGLYQIQRIESAHMSDTLIFDAVPLGSNQSVYTVNSSIGNMGFGTFSQIVAGSDASLSADDSTVLFRGPPTSQLFTLNLNADTQTQITSKVLLGDPDILP